jgi:DNA-binding response OmpR family regulator
MDRKILFIDNIGAVSPIPGILAASDYVVDVAYGGETGLRRLDERNYHVVIVLESPAAESWRFCARIRRQTDMPLIVINFNASTETCVKAINVGADYFMRKPFGPLELLARVGSLFQRNSYRQKVLIGGNSPLLLVKD